MKHSKKSPHNFNWVALPLQNATPRKADEHLRLLKKSESGCEFFISQAFTIISEQRRFIQRYAKPAKRKRTPKRIILTLHYVVAQKHSEFMRVVRLSQYPTQTKHRILDAQANSMNPSKLP